MAGRGPAPKDPENRARRNATVAMTTLPAAGRAGRAPAWPLPPNVFLTTRLKVAKTKLKELDFLADDPELAAGKRAKLDQEKAKAAEAVALLEATLREQRKHEQALWTSLWKTPMAVEWERLAYTREVALYCRCQATAELGDLKAASEARLRSQTLGLTPIALLQLRWRVEEKEAGPAPAPRSGARARYGHLRPVASA